MALKSKTAVGAIRYLCWCIMQCQFLLGCEFRPDVLELDLLLTELSVCSSRSELYFRFMRRKLSSVGSCCPVFCASSLTQCPFLPPALLTTPSRSCAINEVSALCVSRGNILSPSPSFQFTPPSLPLLLP